MSTHDLTTNLYPGNFAQGVQKENNDMVVKTRIIDCSAVVDKTGSTTGIVSGEDYKIMIIPAGTMIMSVTSTCLTAEGGAATVDVGDSSSATTFTSNENINSLGATAGTGVPKYYPAADYIIIHADGSYTAAKFAISVTMFNVAT